MLLQAFTYQLSVKTSDEQAHTNHEKQHSSTHKKPIKINVNPQNPGLAAHIKTL
jgi:hypothetical protein